MLSFDSQTFTWLGRRLMSYAKGGITTNYTYNSDGIRTKKVSGSATTDYCLNGAQILAEKRGGTLINYFYTSDGTRVGFKTGGKVYYYVYNLQGDVTHIVDESKNIVATYRYDPFGKILNLSSLTSIGKLNPFRYRGYYYDTESNLYYLNSRYYNPEIGRFINADAILGANKDLISYNMFTYCGNNPLNRADPTGHFWGLVIVTVVAVSLLIGYVCVSSSNKKHNSKVDKKPSTSTKNKVLNDQHGDTGTNFKYGLYEASHNGCETIAVHNAKVLSGIDSTLSDTMSDFQDLFAMIGFGYFGSNPLQIGAVLKKEQISYSYVGLNGMTKPGVYIISFWNERLFDGLHTVAVSYDGSEYTAYNLKCDGDDSAINPSDYKGKFICGYYIN